MTGTKYQLKNAKGSDSIESIDIMHDNKEVKNLETDYVLGFFGLIMQLGPIAKLLQPTPLPKLVVLRLLMLAQ